MTLEQGTSGVALGLLVVGSGVWHYCVNRLACACWSAEWGLSEELSELALELHTPIPCHGSQGHTDTLWSEPCGLILVSLCSGQVLLTFPVVGHG